MRMITWLVLALAACTSAEERAKEREQAMIDQAKADSASEAEFVEDSIRLAASITVDTVASLRVLDRTSPDDSDVMETLYQARSPSGQVCLLEFTKYRQLAVGDTLACQWAPQ